MAFFKISVTPWGGGIAIILNHATASTTIDQIQATLTRDHPLPPGFKRVLRFQGQTLLGDRTLERYGIVGGSDLVELYTVIRPVANQPVAILSYKW
jgi:hypothetical protein